LNQFNLPPRLTPALSQFDTVAHADSKLLEFHARRQSNPLPPTKIWRESVIFARRMGLSGEPDEIELSGNILANLSTMMSYKKGDHESLCRHFFEALI
jgi:hypothetical protein